MRDLFRVFTIVFGMLATVGFGLCGAAGLVASATGFGGGGWIFLTCGLIGLLLSYAIGKDVWAQLRAKPDEPEDPGRK
jgi:hypothetical protein